MKPIITLALTAGILVTNVAWAQTSLRQLSARSNGDGVSAVSGISWIHHLNRRFEETAMGKTGHLGPAPGDVNEGDEAQVVLVSGAASRLTGEDLYRLNCRGCHGESGQGMPPEINSVIDPVRATSTSLIVQRMKSSGMEISQGAAAQMSREANVALMKRLREGGENMPSFSYLSEPEIAAVIEYLKQLANVPGASTKQIAVKESPLRVGELLVKSTCHTCHDATGPNPNPQQILAGAIPPLEVLPHRVDEPKFIHKITQGSVIVMGDDPIPYRGRMPVFYYLTQQEAADAWLYLHDYPPVQPKKADFYVVGSQTQSGGPGDGSSGAGSGGAVSPQAVTQQNENETSIITVLLLVGIFGFAIVMLTGGVLFTFREFKKLCGDQTTAHKRASRTTTHEAAGKLVGARPVH